MLFWRHRSLLIPTIAALILTILARPVLRATDEFEPTSPGAAVAIAVVIAVLSLPALALHASWPYVIGRRRDERVPAPASWGAVVGGTVSIAGLLLALLEAPYLGAPRIGAAAATGLLLVWNGIELIRARPDAPRIPRSRVLWSGGAGLLLGIATGLALG